MKKLILFGAGKMTKKLLKYHTKTDVEIMYICDNNEELIGKQIHGIEIIPPHYVKELEYDFIYITIMRDCVDVVEQLVALGVPKAQIKLTYSIDAIEFVESDLDEYFEIPKKEHIIPFKKGPAVIYSDYMGETYKSHARREKEGFFEKYCQGEGLDIGYGADLIVPNASGWDLQNGDAQYIKEVEDESFDFVYSSHCLEHMRDVRVALKNWFRVVRRGGYLIIAIPHRDLYEKRKELPSRWNSDHKHMFLIGKSEAPDTLDIIEEVKNSLENYDIKYVKACDEGHTITDPLIHSDGEFQIEMVIKKL